LRGEREKGKLTGGKKRNKKEKPAPREDQIVWGGECEKEEDRQGNNKEKRQLVYPPDEELSKKDWNVGGQKEWGGILNEER